MKKIKKIAKNRDLLESLIGQECWFTATVSRTGTREGRMPHLKETTFALQNIRIDGRRPIADHVWVHMCPALVEAQLRRGDCIEFHARVVPYVTGYRQEPHCSAMLDEIRDVRKIMQKGLYY